ncbi:MAG: sigma-70 family RNA polymerase sigma factor [Lentisphaeraceae bacterium]|nr:sigma-70 family RNA polymerase sigma factor [Lentisphaeraceae bacterium]
MSQNWNTQQTLIQRAQNPEDEQAWDDFVSYYQSFIKMVLFKSNISLNDTDDLIQAILIRIWKGLPNYEYKKEQARFRTWLSTIIRNCIISHINKVKNKGEKVELIEEQIERISESEIEQIISEEWLDYVASIAMDKVKDVFSGNAIEVFRLSLEEKSAKEIASELNITEESVFVLRSRVKSRLKKEISKLRQLIEFK